MDIRSGPKSDRSAVLIKACQDENFALVQRTKNQDFDNE